MTYRLSAEMMLTMPAHMGGHHTHIETVTQAAIVITYYSERRMDYTVQKPIAQVLP